MNMPRSKKPARILDGVSTPALAASAFQAVEDTFGVIWLSQPNGNARLQKIWRRFDHLANLELYTLGAAILLLREDGHDAWLKDKVRTIRKSPTSHGLVTEIIVYPTVGLGSQRLIPAPPKTPAYDFSASSSEGDIYYLSVKNHDITDEAKAFARQSAHLRKLWRERLARERKNLALYLWSDLPMSPDDFELALLHIKSERSTVVGEPISLKPSLYLKVASLTDPVTLAPTETSDTVSVVAPASPREQDRFQRNLRAAADKFRPLGRSAGIWNLLFMRVHVLADIDYLRTLAEQTLSRSDALVDGIIFHQPAYVRDSANASLLNHAFRVVFSPGYITSRKPAIPFRFTPPVGSCSFSAATIEVTADGAHACTLPPNTYIFQQGDIFRAYPQSSWNSPMSLASPASGIREHIVLPGLTISAKNPSTSDDLLVV
ncbi:hypothetical protein [Rhodanobacter sp. ANJX3]|uniref:hypothetical protein n=1 Tax=Rhodanobacter sp. ANJX3 TaxID=2723083 RepID=UPI00160ADEAD|nr:hypothetical protein [Rhodanobacter sp. ANJX3]